MENKFYHWCYEQVGSGGKKSWKPFTFLDSASIESVFESQSRTVSTDGGRFDVDIPTRTRTPIYWTGEPNKVRRCGWFYKVDSLYVPYEEGIADGIERAFQRAVATNEWGRRIELPSGEQVVFHDVEYIAQYPKEAVPDIWGSPASSFNSSLALRRGIAGFNIDAGESEKIDHVLFMVHGIGPVCDLKSRTVEEVVGEFRSMARQLVRAHFKTAYDKGEVGRIEVLPVSWWNALHSLESGIDKKLDSITLESISKFRKFTNETTLDVLFYTSPVFSQVGGRTFDDLL